MGTETSPPAGSTLGSRSRFAAVYRILESAIAAQAFPGCAFGVLAAGDIAVADALGHFTYEQSSPPVTPQTVYDVASLTKVVSTTAIAMLLQQNGLLDLDTPLGEILPGFVVGRPAVPSARSVTLRHLLAHSSGLPGYVEFFRTIQTPIDLYRASLELPLQAEPGSRTEYSDPGFILLGKALELLAHENLATLAHQEVCRPLALSATTFRPTPTQQPLIPPTEEDRTWRMRRIQGEVQDENAFLLNGVAGHAGLFSNVPDLLRFAGAILGASVAEGSELAGGSIFSPKTLDLFSQRQPPVCSSRALGWDTPSENSSSGRYFSQNSIGHLGYSGCSLWIDREANIAVALLTNRTWPDRTSQVIREIRPAFHDAIRQAL